MYLILHDVESESRHSPKQTPTRWRCRTTESGMPRSFTSHALKSLNHVDVRCLELHLIITLTTTVNIYNSGSVAPSDQYHSTWRRIRRVAATAIWASTSTRTCPTSSCKQTEDLLLDEATRTRGIQSRWLEGSTWVIWAQETLERPRQPGHQSKSSHRRGSGRSLCRVRGQQACSVKRISTLRA